MIEYNGEIFVDKYYFVLEMPVKSGTSGSPLFKSDDEDYKIIGIHAKDIEGLITSFYASLKLRREILIYMQENFTQLYYEWNCGKY